MERGLSRKVGAALCTGELGTLWTWERADAALGQEPSSLQSWGRGRDGAYTETPSVGVGDATLEECSVPRVPGTQHGVAAQLGMTWAKGAGSGRAGPRGSVWGAQGGGVGQHWRWLAEHARLLSVPALGLAVACLCTAPLQVMGGDTSVSHSTPFPLSPHPAESPDPGYQQPSTPSPKGAVQTSTLCDLLTSTAVKLCLGQNGVRMAFAPVSPALPSVSTDPQSCLGPKHLGVLQDVN